MSFDLTKELQKMYDMGRRHERDENNGTINKYHIEEMEKRIMDRIDVLEDRLSTKWEK